MQGSAWIDLLRRLPADLHDGLSFGLVTGAEVVVQSLIKMESDFVIVRGRMSGTTAEGRVMMLPYTHLTLVALNKPIAEPDVQALFGKAASPSASALATPAAVTRTAADTPLPPTRNHAADANPPKPAAAGQPKPPPPSKSILLARLRERLAEKSK